MKNILLLGLSVALLTSCSQNQNPKFDKNQESVKKWFELWEIEDVNSLSEMVSEDIEWQGAAYGSEIIKTKADVINYIDAWHGAMESIKYTPDNFLPGVDPETNLPNGSVRTYGTWTGINSASGKSFKVRFYHTFDFNDEGQIINGADYGDATGVYLAVAPDLSTSTSDSTSIDSNDQGTTSEDNE